MRGELFGALLLFKLFFLAAIRREIERKMEMAIGDGDGMVRGGDRERVVGGILYRDKRMYSRTKDTVCIPASIGDPTRLCCVYNFLIIFPVFVSRSAQADLVRK